jgi:heme exporter protein A
MVSPSPPGKFHAELRVRGLVKQYHRRPVLDGLDLLIDPGAFCLLVGANGSGKTTLIRILAGLVRPTAGEIQFGPFSLPADSRRLRGHLGLVGHVPMLYGDLTAAENLRHVARLYWLADPAGFALRALKQVGLAPYRDQRVRTFSRGMQQRLALARALLHDPDLLLLDEPYTGLDQEAARFLDGRLADLHQAGRTILLAIHRPRRLLTLATHVAWLDGGRIRAYLPVDRFRADPNLGRVLEGGP